MPIVEPPSLTALGLVSFQINPQYFFGGTFVKVGEEYVPHFGETRDERIREFHEENDTPVLGLWEAGLLRIEGDAIRSSARRRGCFAGDRSRSISNRGRGLTRC